MLHLKQWGRLAAVIAGTLVAVLVLGFWNDSWANWLHAYRATGVDPEYAAVSVDRTLSEAHPVADSSKAQESKDARKKVPVAFEPPLANFRKAIVMAKLSSEDTSWVDNRLPDWERAIYVVDLAPGVSSPTGLRTKMNKAREAYPYLTYIVEHYSSLPDIAVFLHSHQGGWPQAWHNDAAGYSAVRMLQQLKLETVQKRGYVNLRCIRDPGCPKAVDFNNQSALDTAGTFEHTYMQVYTELFGMTVDAVLAQIRKVAATCCAQFAVTKEQILKRPKEEYEQFLRVIEESKVDDRTLGTIMEYVWHIFFGRDAVHCESMKKCWFEVYGRTRTEFGNS